jgi:hypothetical protein
MKWLDKKVRFIVEQLETFLVRVTKEFKQTHAVTQIIITSPIWIPIVILIVKASRGDFNSEVV